MSIILNGFPYWDDFNEQKGFHRILFKPGFGVQTRELNQLQTILQNQIDKFGKHVFKEGSLVLGGQFNIDTNVSYVHIRNFSTEFNENTEVFKNQVITGLTNDIRAYVLAVEEITPTSAILYIRYLNASEDGDIEEFQPNESIRLCGDSECNSTVAEITCDVDSLDSTGMGSIFSIDEGVVFTNGYFVWFPRQLISLGTTTTPSKVVGFDIVTDLVTNNQDISLLDNAQGSYNWLAPGADRLRIDASLTKMDVPDDISDIITTENFVLLFIMRNGDIQQIKDTPQYSEIYNELATRTYEESGHYVVEGFSTRVREHLNTGENEGLLTLANGGDSTMLVAAIQPGKAYVEGHRIINHTPYNLIVPKSTNVENKNNEIVTAVTGDYVIINEVVGAPVLDSGTIVTLRNGAATGIAGGRNLSTAPGGTQIGTAKVKDMQYVSGTPGTGTAQYALYLYDIQMNAMRNFAQTQSFFISGVFHANAVTPAGVPLSLLEGNQAAMLFPLGSSAVRAIRDVNGQVDTSFTFRRTQTANIGSPSGGISTFTISVVTSSDGEVHDYGNSGTVPASLKSTFVITDGNGKHVRPEHVEITVVNNTQLSFAVQMTTGSYAAGTGSVTYNVTRTIGREGLKILRPNRYIKIHNNTGSTITAPINLGLADVFRLNVVRHDTSAITTTDGGTDITASCILDNGQRDSFYDHAKLIVPGGLANGHHLLVGVDYFFPDFTNGVGYFSVDSYPINDEEDLPDHIFTHEIPVYKSSFNGQEYNLRNHLDFRAVKVNTATDATTVAAAPTNPATTNNFVLRGTGGGLRMAAASSPIRVDYSYYLARRDIAVVDKDGNYDVIMGVPAVAPVSPSVSENVMGLARLYIPPYPSLATTYARILNVPEQGVRIEGITTSRHTMRDIGTLKRRVETLEYYNALSLLERSAIDMLVADENGFDRFKNGFFVDGFMDHSLGATYNPDYNVSIDKEEQALRPFFDMESYKYVPTVTPPVGGAYVTKGALTTLRYEQVVLLEQMNVTGTRNIEQSVFRFVGNCHTVPDSDIWVDTKTVDARVVDYGSNLRNTMYVNWNSWENHVLGHNVYARKRGDRSGVAGATGGLVGTFDSYADAASAGGKRTVIETLTQEQRTGIKTSVNYQKETRALGERVIDISVEPYIRPQVIKVVVRGVKARTRYSIFFDGENMNEFLTPLNPVTNARLGAEGSDWRANDYGELTGFLRLPASGKRFRIGNKEIKITDSPTNSVDATSYAIGHFFAHGMVQQKQNTILSTKHAVVTQQEIVQKKRVKQTTEVMGPSCMAYSFKPEVPEGEVGCFLTSVDVWIESVHPTLGVWFEIREMDNAGNITRNQVPYSEVWYTSSEILPNVTGSVFNRNKFHTVTFPSPVFLYNDTEYAFVIHTEGLNPDTYFWISRLGETNLITGKQVNARQLTGNVYTTNNNMNWDMVPDIDLMVRFKRARFTASSATFVVGNEGYEFLTVTPNTSQYVMDKFGEVMIGSQALTINNVIGVAPVPGDVISQGSATGEIVAIVGNKFYTTGFGFTNPTGSTPVTFSNGATGTMIAIASGSGKLYKLEDNKTQIQLSESTGNFFVGCVIKREAETDPAQFATINSIDDWKFSAIHNTPNHLVLHNTSCVYEHRARTSGSGVMPSTWERVEADENVEFDSEKTILSRSTELSQHGGARSSELRITLQSSSEFVSPVIDFSRINAVYVHNIINNPSTGELTQELQAHGGTLINRYISKTVTLADGQDAEDLMVVLTAYRPSNSDVKVWYKIRNAEDGDTFGSKPWVEMTPRGLPTSSLVNKSDFKEITFDVPAASKDGGGQVFYTSNGATFTGFKQFAIKVGLMGTNSAIVPRVGDLRAIALQL